MAAIADYGVTVLDCADPRALAEFYAAILGSDVDENVHGPDPDWFEVKGPHGRLLAFQGSPGYQPPEWPGTERGQQFHLDFDVPRDRLDEAERQVLALGAKLLEGDGGGKRDWRIYLDPAGHPFCLCVCAGT